MVTICNKIIKVGCSGGHEINGEPTNQRNNQKANHGPGSKPSLG